MGIGVTLEWTKNGQQHTEYGVFPDDEQGFWQAAASKLHDMDIPNRYRVLTWGRGEAVLDVTQRGTYFKGEQEVPSMFVTCDENDIALSPSKYEDAYLTCINPNTSGGRGNYKFYQLHQLSDGSVTAYYGRIGQSSGFGAKREIRDPMPSWMFEVRKAEKLSKGYVDQTDTYLGGEVSVSDGCTSRHEPNREDNLYNLLLAFAEHRVMQSLVQGTKVSTEQVKASRSLIDSMGGADTLESFNELLLKLMQVSPRNVPSVQRELADSTSDYGRILDREESLLAAMEAVASDKDSRKERKARPDRFAENGIAVREADERERGKVMSCIPQSLKHRVRRIWHIDPMRQRKRHEAYRAEHNIGADGVKLMWHGSRNENWCSIVEKSLMLNPNAQITGKMFGYGIYFGYDELGNGALKSWNYTSARGTYWAHGRSDTAFMGLYECAYGTPHYPSRARQFTARELNDLGANCVHAKGSTCGLAHDEVVFFDEAAVCLAYLVEFEG